MKKKLFFFCSRKRLFGRCFDFLLVYRCFVLGSRGEKGSDEVFPVVERFWRAGMDFSGLGMGKIRRPPFSQKKLPEFYK